MQKICGQVLKAYRHFPARGGVSLSTNSPVTTAVNSLAATVTAGNPLGVGSSCSTANACTRAAWSGDWLAAICSQTSVRECTCTGSARAKTYRCTFDTLPISAIKILILALPVQFIKQGINLYVCDLYSIHQ